MSTKEKNEGTDTETTGKIAIAVGTAGFLASGAVGGGATLAGAIVAGMLNPLFFVGVPLGWYLIQRSKKNSQSASQLNSATTAFGAPTQRQTNRLTVDCGSSNSNQTSHEIDLQIDRLAKVLEVFASLEENDQLDLTETAILWAFACLAKHPARYEGRALFFANINIVYTLTEHAISTHSKSELEQISTNFYANRDSLVPRVGNSRCG